MNKRTMDEMIAYFNQEVSKMDISQENKMKLLGMITAIGYENKKQDVVRCKDCKYYDVNLAYGTTCFCTRLELLNEHDWFCADGVRRE